MIDNIALFIGHLLLAIALLRLVMRERLDVDPLLARFQADEDERRKAKKTAGRRGRRGAKTRANAPSPQEPA